MLKLADAKGEPLAGAPKSLLSSKVPMLDFSQDRTIDDAVASLLIKPPANGWKPLLPANGVLEAWLGSDAGKQRWVHLPVVAGGSISDAFTRADETPIATPWTKMASSAGTDLRLNTNKMGRITTTGNTLYYYSWGSGWNADQSSQFDYVTAFTNADWGPCVRVGAGTGYSGYLFNQQVGALKVYKIDNGTFTALETAAGTGTFPRSNKIDVSGSTIGYYFDGVADANSPVTDTSFSGAGNGAGVHAFDVNGELDNFLATGEISAGGAAPRLTLMGVG